MVSGMNARMPATLRITEEITSLIVPCKKKPKHYSGRRYTWEFSPEVLEALTAGFCERPEQWWQSSVHIIYETVYLKKKNGTEAESNFH